MLIHITYLQTKLILRFKKSFVAIEGFVNIFTFSENTLLGSEIPFLHLLQQKIEYVFKVLVVLPAGGHVVGF